MSGPQCTHPGCSVYTQREGERCQQHYVAHLEGTIKALGAELTAANERLRLVSEANQDACQSLQTWHDRGTKAEAERDRLGAWLAWFGESTKVPHLAQGAPFRTWALDALTGIDAPEPGVKKWKEGQKWRQNMGME
jgi:hypothetical protein